jgi:hypothetical protein
MAGELVWHATVEGYADPLSVAQGEPVRLRCSATSSPITIEVARVGGQREVVWQRDDIPASYAPLPAEAWAKGCDWPVTTTIQTDASWRSGYYEVVLRGADDVSHAFFAVRPGSGAERRSIILVLSTATYNAYNNWGGSCLYEGSTVVSFARPMARGFLHRRDVPEGRAARVVDHADPDRTEHSAFVALDRLSRWCSAAGWFNWERRFVQWAERAGYRIDIATSVDLERVEDLLRGYRLFLSVGHDEYWSWGMREAVEDFIASGGNAAFMSGDSVYWQVRFSDEGQAMTCHKYTAHDTDPVVGTEDSRYMTGLWSDPIVGRPENHLTGVTMNRGGYVRVGGGVPRGSGGYMVWRPDHWVFAGTDLRYGDLLGATHTVVGYEADGCELRLRNGLPVPTHADGTPETFQVLATSPAHLWSNAPGADDFPATLKLAPDEPGDLEFTALRLLGDASEESVAQFAHGHAVMGVYERGGTVFTTGCTEWAYGLDDRWEPRLSGPDPDVDRITRNILDRFAGA